jgi:hypothetical protein
MNTPFPRPLTSIAVLIALTLSACNGGSSGSGEENAAPSNSSGNGSGSTVTTVNPEDVIKTEPVAPGVDVVLLAAQNATGTHANLIKVDFAALKVTKNALFAD